jgi:hypothetical protein
MPSERALALQVGPAAAGVDGWAACQLALAARAAVPRPLSLRTRCSTGNPYRVPHPP